MSCLVILEKRNKTYHAGDKITGTVVCNFNDDTKVRGIKIRIRCKERNDWTKTEYETVNGVRRQVQVHFTGDNYVLNVEKTLFGSGGGSTVLNRGRHEYPFCYTLPHDIPSSFSGSHGSISYTLQAIVERPLFRFDYKCEVTFKLVAPIDFNKLPLALQNPTYLLNEKSVCCWCCRGGNITLDVEISRKAFVPGETIPVKVQVCNLSNVSVRELNIYLERIMTYKVTSPRFDTKKEKFRIVSHTDHGVGAHGEHTFNLQLKIPERIIVPNFSKCRLFKVSYMMKVSCKMPSFTLDLSVEMRNIQIGDIQRRQQRVEQNDFERVYSRDRPQPSAPVETLQYELPPPSYEDVTSNQ